MLLGGRTKIFSSPYALGALFVGLALMWVLQMRLAKEQATSFLNIVNELKGPGLTVSIGVNQPKWGRKKIYVAVSANQDSIIVDAVTLEGTTVFAKGKKESTLIGKTLSESDLAALLWKHRFFSDTVFSWKHRSFCRSLGISHGDTPAVISPWWHPNTIPMIHHPHGGKST